MTPPALPQQAEHLSRRVLPMILLLFIGSGACALIYEVVWFQLLELVIGSTAISLTVLLATFMGGMCIGSLAFPRYAPRTHPLRLYAMLEIGIGIIGLLELFLIPVISQLYSPAVGHGAGALMLRALVAGLCLLPPTVLMGATLPAIARWVESSPRGISWVGFFYGANIVGAVFGSVAAGFYLLRLYDQVVTICVAVALNIIIGVIAWSLASVTNSGDARSVDPAPTERAAITASPRARLLYVSLAISGGCALAAEVVWTRLLSLTFGASVFTFSLILAVFLSGLGIGGAAAARLSRNIASSQLALVWCQVLVAVSLAWAAALIFVALPNWPISPALAPSPWFTMQLDLVRCALAVFPAAAFWGASFPFALSALSTPGVDTSRLVGRVYAANTLGSIIGAVMCTLLLIPAFGTRGAQGILIAAAALSAAIALLAKEYDDIPGAHQQRRIGLLLITLLAAVLITTLPALPGTLVAYGRNAVVWRGKTDIMYVGEGMNSSVAVSHVPGLNAFQFHVAGKIEGSTFPQDMRMQTMLAHIPALVHPAPRSVLVVGFGTGVTAGAFLNYPSVNHLVVCEIEPLIPKVISTWFVKENNNVVHDPRTQIHLDDARSFVLTTDETFDVITSEPINPWVKGVATLYTREYFQAVKRRLKPGGVVAQWVPLYETTRDALRSELATFFEVFPDGTIWANTVSGRGYDLVLLGSSGSLRVDISGMDKRFQAAGYDRVGQSLISVGFTSPAQLFSTYAGSAADLKTWLGGSAINTDRNLRLQYLAGMGVDNYASVDIYNEILRHRRFPDDLFSGSDTFKATLRDAMGMPK